jgi:hypothetical protein
MFFLAFGAGISGQTRRIKGVPPTIIHLQIAAYSSAVLLIVIPIMIWWAAAFRPLERSTEVTQTLKRPRLDQLRDRLRTVRNLVRGHRPGHPVRHQRHPCLPPMVGIPGPAHGVDPGRGEPARLLQDRTVRMERPGLVVHPAHRLFLWFVIMTVLTTKAINADHRDLAESPRRTESLLAEASAVEGGHVHST